MLRRISCWICLACCCLTSIRAQEDTSLYRFMCNQLQHKDNVRRGHLSGELMTLSQMERYAMSSRVAYTGLLSLPSSKLSLQAQTYGVLQRAHFVVEKVVYESEPGNHVTANLYIPVAQTANDKKKYPAVLLLCGAGGQSKAVEEKQEMAQLLASNGFVVLLADPLNGGERRQYTSSGGYTAEQEQIRLSTASLLMGSGLANEELWDNIRALDYLESRPEVNNAQLACIAAGNDIQPAGVLMVYDDRLKAMVMVDFEGSNALRLCADRMSNAVHLLPFENYKMLDVPEQFAVFAPKPVLFFKAAKAGTPAFSQAYEDIKKIYKTFGHEENITCHMAPVAPGLSGDRPVTTLRFLLDCFYGRGIQVAEPEITLFTEAELQCTATGSVMTDFPGEQTVSLRERKIARRYEKQRGLFATYDKAAACQVVKDLLPFTYNRTLAGVTEEELPAAAYTLHQLQLTAGGQPDLACLLLQPAAAGTPREVLLYVHESGKAAVFEDSVAMRSLAGGVPVLAIDLRGAGEYSALMLAMYLGYPMPGQRTADVLMAVDYIRKRYARDVAVKVVAYGQAYPAVLHAALFDEAITVIKAGVSVRSWMQLLENQPEESGLSYVVPNVLKYYDLIDLEALLRREKVKINVETN